MINLNMNKKVIIICMLLVVITFIIYLISLGNNKIIASEENFEYLKKYGSNEFIPVYVTNDDIVKKYLNDYKNDMLYNVERAYDNLNKDYKEKKFGNLDKYKDYVNGILSFSTYSMEVDRYSISYEKDYKIFSIYDKSGYQYIFKEKSIMNYEVYLDQYTVEIN